VSFLPQPQPQPQPQPTVAQVLRRLPAEWEPQSGILLIWPHAQSGWKHMLAAVQQTYIDMLAAITPRETVAIICFDEQHQQQIQDTLRNSSHVINWHKLRFATAPSNDSWARDTAPITVLETTHNVPSSAHKTVLLDFSFNGWGGKYPAELDNHISRCLQHQRFFKTPDLRSLSFILEGGSIESDGEGTLLTTRRCLTHPNRNTSLNKNDIEQLLRDQLGVEQILWLHNGRISGDDTDSHIDTLARFCPDNTLVYSHCEDTQADHYHALNNMKIELGRLRNTHGQAYHLVPLPLPAPIYNAEGMLLPANYCNFLIINNALLLPTYNDSNDAVAQRALKHCFPEREIIAIDCRSLLEQYGSLHCATMQFPEGVL
jgi:agmatine deiminase